MDWLDKLKKSVTVTKQVASVALPVADAVGVPGAGAVQQVVDAIIQNPNDPQNLRALRQVAAEVDDLRRRVGALEMKAGRN